MEKIPTAREFDGTFQLLTYGRLLQPSEEKIEFAKLHVKAALEAAAKNVRTITKEDPDWDTKYQSIDKESILSAYPLENIK